MAQSAKQIETAEDVRQLGTILVVGAHPDDESFVAAGIMAMAAAGGQRVASVTATKGEGGVQDEARWPAATLGETRTEELAAALAVLGATEHVWLDYADGGCAAADEAEAVRKLVAVMERVRPDTVLTFGPEGLTGHPDHQAVSRWARLAAGRVDWPVRVLGAVLVPEQYAGEMKVVDERLKMFFNLDEPPIVAESECVVCCRLPEAVVELKRRAFAAMPSQMERLLGEFTPAGFAAGFGIEAFVELKKEA